MAVNPAYWPAFGDGFEPVTELNAATVSIFSNGVALAASGATCLLLSGGGAAPPNGTVLTWSGQYFRRVHFASDSLKLDRLVLGLWSGKQIDFISVK